MCITYKINIYFIFHILNYMRKNTRTYLTSKTNFDNSKRVKKLPIKLELKENYRFFDYYKNWNVNFGKIKKQHI